MGAVKEPHTDRSGADGFSWRRVIGLFGPHRGRVIGVALLVFFVAGLGIVNPLLLRVVFDEGLFAPAGVDLGLVLLLAAVMVATSVVSGTLEVFQTVATNRLGQGVLRDLRNMLYAHLQHLSVSFYASTRTGDLQSRINSDVGGIQTAVTSTITSVLSNAVTFVGALVAMALLSVPLTVLSLATVPIYVYATRVVGRRRERYTHETQTATAEMSVITQETLSVSGITLSKLFGRSDAEIARFAAANERLAQAATKQQSIGYAFFSVIGTFMSVAPIATYLVAALLLRRDFALTAGTVVAVTTLQSRLFYPVARLLETTVELQSSRALFRRIFGYLDTPIDIADVENPVSLVPATTQGEVRFDHVHFAYGSDPGHEALQDVTLTASPRQLIAFVGPSGSGKTTILNLAARLYDPTRGSITIDGTDLRQIALASLPRAVGFVTQESYLFAGSLRDNLVYGSPTATDEEIEKACRAAAIHDRIVELPAGYDTGVGERGTRLSGGERQRVAIARVLLADPRVLVLDEATSALDTASERRIQEALGELLRSRTTLAVAHRLSTIQAADTIHVINHGKIVESGDHDTLLAAGGVYAGLYFEQYGGGTIEAMCHDGVVYANGSCSYFENRDFERRLTSLQSR
ncbi:ABC transporter ATP-binding protein [Candidatus Poriferisodalis sp.]|uniref:ABC transporter ATP-binding protein n=1 Tax=Candidatus Poriferisodalis sp. TaxID=3101277 RepID=UPI003B5C7937